MSTYVENQVVELEFDNRDFEKNVSTSLKTLETLKEKLKFENASKGFHEIQNGLNSINFTPFLGQLNDMESQFTSFIGRLELNIKDFLAGETIAKFQELFTSTIGQIKSGGRSRAQNIEQAQFKIKGLEKDWNKVYEDMDYAVSGTAYGIDQAANAAAQFLASNVHTGEDMKAALRGISGIAAMTSSGYDEIARVFTAAAGKGRVMALELNRISLRGVNAAAALAKYLNTTEAQVRKLASEGQISFQTFANAMDAAFGEHAKKANETFAGSLSNVRAALSRIGEIYYEPWIRSMIPFFNALRTAIDSVKNALKGLVGTDEEGNKVFDANNVAANLKNLLLTIGDLKTEIVKSFIPSLDGLTSRFDWLNEKLQNATIIIRAITEAFKKYNKIKGNTEKKVEEQAKESTGITSSEDPKFLGLSTQIAGVAITLDKEVGSTVTSIIDRYKALYDAQKSTLQSTTNLFSKWTYQYKTSFSELNKALKSNKWGLETLSKDMAKLEGKGILSTKFIERLKSMGSSGAEIVHALANATDKDLKEYMQTWEQTEGMFDTISGEWTKDAKKQAEDSLNQITGIPQATMEDYMNTFGDMFKQLGISDAAGYSQGFLQSFESMETLYARQLDAIDEYNKKMQEAADAREAEEDAEAAKKNKYKATYEIIENYTERLYKAMTSNKIIVNIIDNMQQTFRDLFATLQEIGHRIYEIFEAIGGAYIEVWKKFNVVDGEVVLNPIQKLIALLRFLIENFQISGERAELIKSTFKGVFAVFELVKWAINNLIDAIAPFLITLSQGEPIILRVTGALGEFVTAIVNRIINGEPIGDALDNLLGSIRGFFSGLLDLLKGDGKESEGLLGNIFSAIKNIFNKIVTAITTLFSNPEKEVRGNGFGEFLSTLFGEIFNIERLSEIFGDTFEYLKATFSDVWGIADTFLTIIPDIMETAWGFIKNNGDAISNLLTSIINLATKLVNAVSSLIDKLMSGGSGDSSGKKKELSKGMETLYSFLDLVISALKFLKEIIDQLTNSIKNSGVINNLVEVFNKILAWMAEDGERTYGMAAFFTIMRFLILLQQNKKTFKTGILESVKQTLTSVTGFFKQLQATVKGSSISETFFDKLKKLALSILMIAAAVWLLSKALTTKDGKINAGGIIALIALFAFMMLMGKLIDEWTRVAQISTFDIALTKMELYQKGLRKLAVSFAIIVIALAILSAVLGHTEHPMETALSSLIIVATVLIFMAAIIDTITKQMGDTTATGLMAQKNMSNVAKMFLAFGVAVSMIIFAVVPLILVVSLLQFLLKDDFYTVLSGVNLVLVLVMAGLVGMMYVALQFTKEKTDMKALMGMAVLMVAFAVSMGIIIGALTALMAIVAITEATNSMEVFGIAFGSLIAIMVLMVVVMKLMSNIKGDAFVKMAVGMVGISIMLSALSEMLLVIAGMVLAFKFAGVTSTDVQNVLDILEPVLIAITVMIGIFALLAVVFKSGGPGAIYGAVGAAVTILAIAAAIYVIAKAFSTLVISIALFLAVAGGLAYFWDEIEPGFDKMLTYLDKKLPELIALIGKGVRALAAEIKTSAPIIADAIVAVMTAIIFVTMQKVPAHALAWLMVIDEVLTIILKGGGVIINKFLLLLEMVLVALDTNADVLGYQIGHVLMKAFLYAIDGAFAALMEYIEDFVNEFYDELLGTFFDGASNWKVNEKIGDMIWKWTHGETFSEAEMNEKRNQQIWVQGKGWVQYTDKYGNKLQKSAEVYDKKAKEAKKKIDEANDELNEQEQGEKNGYQVMGMEWKKADYSGLQDAIDETAEENKELKELAKEYGVSTEEAAEVKNNGTISAESWSGSFTDTLNSEEGNPIINFFKGLVGGDKTKDAASENGEETAKAWMAGVNGIIGNVTGKDSLFGMQLMQNGDLTSMIPTFNNGSNAASPFSIGSYDMMQDGSISGMDYSSWYFNNAADIKPIDGSETGLENYTYSPMQDQTAAYQQQLAEGQTANTEGLEKLNTAVNALTEKLNSVILIDKNSQVNVTAAIDGQECGNVLYPIMESIAAQKASMEEAGVAH